jgi:hypothetical protein
MMGIQIAATLGATAWLGAGMLVGAGGLALARRLKAWREARIAAEWDPY